MKFKELITHKGVRELTGNSAVIYITCIDAPYARDVRRLIENEINEFYVKIERRGRFLTVTLK